MLKLTEIKEGESTRLYIYRTIKESIVELYLKPGDMINETHIAKELKTSRTPVREAFVLLEQEQLIEIKTKKGTYVSKISLKAIETFVFIRRAVEQEIIKLACQHIETSYLEKLQSILDAQKIIVDCDDTASLFFILDNEFHKTIYSAVKKENVWESMIHFESAFNRLRKLDSMEQSHIRTRYEEHVELLSIIKENRINEVEAFIKKHLNALEEAVPRLLQQYPDYFKE